MKTHFKNKILQAAFFSTLFLPASSWALFEARASYGLLTSKQNLSDICTGSCAAATNAPAIVPSYGLGLDAIVKLPLIPIGFGMRYEKMGFSASTSSIDAKLDYTRTSLLLNYRLIDTIVHFGPIATYGLSHTGSLTMNEGGVAKVDLSPKTISSYSIGLELEVKPLIVIPIVVGAELGYMNMQWKDVTNSIDATTKNVDLSGSYMKIFLGIDI
ncbi:MAG: hypothetical protein WA160_09840 [Pseudobdellovibrio sp.]